MDGLPPRDAPEDLDLGQVAEQLRLLRLVSQQRRYAGRPVPRLPVRAEITDLLADLIAALYPRHYGPSGLPPDRTDGYVVALLPALRERLARQVELEFLLAIDAEPADCHDRARQTADRVMGALPRIRDLHDTDIAAAYAGDPSAKSLDEIVFCYPGVAAALRHRIAHELYGAGATMIARIMAEHSHSVTGIDIHPGARIGPACFIDHGTGVVIGETAVIGRNAGDAGCEALRGGGRRLAGQGPAAPSGDRRRCGDLCGRDDPGPHHHRPGRGDRGRGLADPVGRAGNRGDAGAPQAGQPARARLTGRAIERAFSTPFQKARELLSRRAI